MPLTQITPESYGVEFDLAYARADNVTGRPIYARAACFLHPAAAELLERAVALARPLGYRLRIFDAYRPTEAQWKLWEVFPSTEFVADPRSGSPHSRGVAVDLTLVDAASGQALEMGTGFDDFSQRAYHGNLEVSAMAQRNRAILLGLMTAAGWDWFRNEWWHYQLFNSRAYPLISDSALAEPIMPQPHKAPMTV